MAALISVTSGNWSASGTWATIDPVSFLDKNPASFSSVNVITTPIASAAFTPGAITVDGIGICIYNVNNNTGTLSVYLDQAGTPVPGTTVVINASDLGIVNNLVVLQGWVFFKFVAPVTLFAVTPYTIKVVSSVSNSIVLTTNSTLCRFLRTMTTVAIPTTGDLPFILGELTGQGTGNDITVTMDNTATTLFGHINTGYRGTLTFATVPGTYYLRTSGQILIGTGSTLNIGSSTIPYIATAIIEMIYATNVLFGFDARYNSTMNIYGQSKTLKTNLSVNALAGTTTITVDDVTGWSVGDTIALATTSQITTQSESRTISNISGNVITIPALTYTHIGPLTLAGTTVSCEVINLTNNIKIRGASGTLQGYVRSVSANVNCQYAEFSWLGSSSGSKRGIEFNNHLSSVVQNFKYNSIHDFLVSGSIGTSIDVSCYNQKIIGNIYYNIAAWGVVVNVDSTAKSVEVSYNTIIFCAQGSSQAGILLLYFRDVTCNYNNVSGSTGSGSSVSGITVGDNSDNYTVKNFASFMGNICHSSYYGIYFNQGLVDSPYFKDNICYRNSVGFGISNHSYYDCTMTLDNHKSFGNAVDIYLGSPYYYGTFFIKNSNCGIDPAYPNEKSVQWWTSSIHFYKLVLLDSNFSTPMETNMPGAKCFVAIRGNNFVFSNSYIGALPVAFSLSIDNFNGIVGNYYGQNQKATWVRDNIYYSSSPSSMRVTAAHGSTTDLVTFGSFRVPVAEGIPISPLVKIRRSNMGDTKILSYESNSNPYSNTKAIYLCVKRNLNLQIAQDTIIGTLINDPLGSWNTLTGSITPLANGVMEFAVGFTDFSGSYGWFNVDDFFCPATLNGEAAEDGLPIFGVATQVTNNFISYSRRKIV
jgi:hypothetical protein